jgi:hypothetical protein
LAPSQLPLGDGLEHAPPDRTTSRYSPISNPELDSLPLGIPTGVLGKGKIASVPSLKWGYKT